MGLTPAKYFPYPTPYGQSPETGVLQQAKAAPQAPLNNFLPLNSQDPSQAPQAQPQMAQGGFPSQFGGAGGMGRSRSMYGGGLQRNVNI